MYWRGIWRLRVGVRRTAAGEDAGVRALGACAGEC